MTAVEWLMEQWPILESQIPPYIIEEAKEMEKQMIREAYDKGEFNDGMNETAEEYYNQTYGSQDNKTIASQETEISDDVIIPKNATNVEVFAIKPDEDGKLFAYIGYKMPNGNFHFTIVPFTEPIKEISDEEIDKASKEHFIGETLWSERVAFKLAIKWYRDRIQAATATAIKIKTMTPKEKAEELKERFDGYICYAEAAVDEILDCLTTSLDIQVSLMAVDYWKQVREEIQKL